MQVRSGEDKKTWFRSDRFFHTADGWFFITREASQKGPFNTQKEAENELTLYIRHMTEDALTAPLPARMPSNH
ncbi:DUF6316 family protein [Pleionea sp. CnH1-48]|uniref:DUF6316 family protein n=1 Tax=Pleionea sp. CnH1-48 TaxID=2954494 RepID=UPI002096FBF0|nr:DUF6316 family protein [Pleionea sp. CnH1-48]MCO7224545.1 DUF6316 family protein [Pleionea sp. CnH1-48]